MPLLLDTNIYLLALSARRIGAQLFTLNREDFLLIRRYRSFALVVPTITGAP